MSGQSTAERRGPDFAIAGAPRCGTTWLYHLLERHPEVQLAQPVRPEPKFFLVDELYERGVDYYLERWFPTAPAGRTVGEKSTNYLESPVAARRLHEHFADVRLVFILREPADRAYSNYRWSRSSGMESASFEEALELEEAREAECPPELRYARPHAYFSRGLYADMLAPWFELFPPSNILCLRFEDIIGSPRDLAGRLHAFLEVERRPHDADALPAINEAPPDAAPEAALAALRHAYRPANQRLADLLGSDFELWDAA